MAVELFILIDFSFGPVTLTSAPSPQTRSFDGIDRVYLPTLEDYSLPPVVLNPMASSQGTTSTFNFSFFAYETLPGSVLAQRMVLQGSNVRAWVEYGHSSKLIFDGQISNVEYKKNLACIGIAATRKTTILAKMFPPARILDEGRFVERRTYRRDSATTEETFEIQLLVPVVNFRSVFGTPENPSSIGPPTDTVTYIPTSWDYEPNASATIGDAVLHFDDNQKNSPVPVCYGYHPNPVPVSVAFHYRVRQDTIVLGVPVTRYFKVFIAFLGAHEVLGDSLCVPVYNINQEYSVRIFMESSELTTGYGFTTGDRAGGTASYITFFIQYTDATFEETSSSKEISETDFYVKNLRGKPGPGGTLISGLGSMLKDSWNSYGGANSSYLDWGIIEQTSQELDQFDVSFLANAANQNQTLEKLLFQRLGSQFPITFGYPRGKLAWQSTLIDDKKKPIRHLEMGLDLISRDSIKETSISGVLNNLSVAFGVNGTNGNDSDSVVFNASNNEICRSSKDRWGARAVEELSIADTTSAATASIIGQQMLMLRGGIRLISEYTTTDLKFLDYPLLSVFEITDDQAGLNQEKFYLYGIQWNKEFNAIKVSFLSQKMV